MVVEYTYPKDDSLKTNGELRDSSNGCWIRLNLESFRRKILSPLGLSLNRRLKILMLVEHWDFGSLLDECPCMAYSLQTIENGEMSKWWSEGL